MAHGGKKDSSQRFDAWSKHRSWRVAGHRLESFVPDAKDGEIVDSERQKEASIYFIESRQMYISVASGACL